MCVNFWKSKGSLSLLYNYHKALLTIYDIVILEERRFVAEEGTSFDEGSYFLNEFSNEEGDILSTEIPV